MPVGGSCAGLRSADRLSEGNAGPRPALSAYTYFGIILSMAGRKPIVWMGSSLRDMKAMPSPVKKDFGGALHGVQEGRAPPNAKKLKGAVEGAVQLSEDFDGDTYRAVYTTELEGVVYVLHCFQKKSKAGIETPKAELDTIEQRLKGARKLHAQRATRQRSRFDVPACATEQEREMTKEIEYVDGGDNVFADLGFDEETAARLARKSELVSVLYRYQVERNLSQKAFSHLVGIPQPKLSKLYNGKVDGVSVEKLIDAIARLGGKVTIKVEAHPLANAGRIELELT